MKYTSITKYCLVGLILAGGCTNLDETDVLYDTVISDNFYKTDREFLSAVGAAYSNLFGWGGNNHMIPLNEVTTDEMVVPTRGADWGDGGHWVRLQTHTYTSQDPTPTNGWTFLYSGVNTCNRLLATFEPLGTDQAKAYIAELKVLRAIYYYWLLDLYGNVPLSIDFSSTEPPANSTRQQVYDFVEKELLENVPLLQKTGPTDESTYGRVNYYTGYTALAKLYLNAKIYTGTEQWEKAIAACDEVINSGKYALVTNYSDNFKKENKGSTEFIWAIPYDAVYAKGFNMPMMTLHMQNQNTYKMNAQPWNGFATIQEFYQSYIDPVQNPGPQGTVVGVDTKGTTTTGTQDKRLSNFLVGPQYMADGSPLTDGGADAADPNGAPITFTPYINELQPNAWRQSGARIGKWEFYTGMTADLSNDWPLFRYADVLLMKAEATARKNDDWNDPIALALVNQIRTVHGGVTPFVSMTADTFLAERGREMFAETFRRQDLIRFGKYNSAWRFHAADASDNLGPAGINHLNIFPIPATQINANQNLKQNPGY
ncbi:MULTISPECIES: RagB/SusD family nutrient uptake outer membrane protein [Xanthocytophaga]|uniref:RagB/SusD family nutrient uptake outer membrane protein n=2 Tax=Xanthocytophaga TaxID=3078918 RepID=A0AAE3U5D8_9BACT|nr:MULTISPECIES: RagB/SusD family nutrient uptake outer membrane protein [Xanthocytophaga]MDJ1480674.1 RagB/SusD family nutrient uptake outer membrane protein [Xanthocytophaga flavus]MDJ1506397.1 RagB/SusD family nutrient uptake outer membrane protein [Xanthocytophaga agilis]